MSLINFILNLVALLLWLSWRAGGMTAATRPSVLSLASALKKADPRGPNRWLYLVALALLLVLRSVFYWQVGAPMRWTPTIQLGVIAPHFRSDFLERMLLFSALSFVVVLAVFYFSLILLSISNRSVSDSDPIQKVVRLQLGWLGRWSVSAQLLLPFLLVVALWLALHRLFAGLGLISVSVSFMELAQQAAIIGLGAFLAWKYFIVALLAAHVLNSYVYLGNSPIWNFVNVTAHNLLRPIRWLPLGIGKADLRPLVAILLVLVIAHYGGGWLTRLYQHPPL
jgi:uncharacterized protein YggT (Ycf19 family)